MEFLKSPIGEPSNEVFQKCVNFIKGVFIKNIKKILDKFNKRRGNPEAISAKELGRDRGAGLVPVRVNSPYKRDLLN